MRWSSVSSVLSVLLWVAGCLGCVACVVVERPAPAVQAPARVEPAPAPVQVAEAEPEILVAVASVPPAIEDGYEHCCGDDQFRLEIGCGYSELRCYESIGDGWRRTYGRHCKEKLGMACYLNGCDNRCQ